MTNIFSLFKLIRSLNILNLVGSFTTLFLLLYNNIVDANDLPNFSNETKAIISNKQENIIGKICLHQLRKAGFLEQDPTINAYLNHIGNTLLTYGKQVDLEQFNFFALKGEQINAFAFWGGNIGVFSGLINLTDTESELAAILAHEISHVTQKHFARHLLHQQKLMPVTIAQSIIAIATGVPDLIMPLFGLHVHQTLVFSRENEQEADRIGIQLLIKSNFDPKAMPKVLEKLSQNQGYSSNNRSKIQEYLLTHPMFENRIPDVYNRIEKIRYKQHIDNLDYSLIKAKIKVQLNNKASTSKNILTHRLAEIDDKLKTRRYNNYIALKYEQALILRHFHKDTAAKNILLELTQKNSENNIIALSLAETIAINDPKAAKMSLEKLIQITPDYLPVVLFYAELLCKLNLTAEAKNVLTKYNKHHIYELIEEPKIYELLINCYQKLNELDNSLLTQAKLLIINNDLHLAKEKIVQALKAAELRKNKYNINAIKKFQKELDQFVSDIHEIKL